MELNKFLIDTIKEQIVALKGIEKLKEMNIDDYVIHYDDYTKGIKEAQRIVEHNSQIISESIGESFSVIRRSILETAIEYVLKDEPESRV